MAELYRVALQWANGDEKQAADLVAAYYAGQVAAQILKHSSSRGEP